MTGYLHSHFFRYAGFYEVSDGSSSKVVERRPWVILFFPFFNISFGDPVAVTQAGIPARLIPYLFEF